jgi:hypothetical protein
MQKLSTRTGLSPTMARLSSRFRFLLLHHWPGPRSLATTNGVSVDVLSSGYLDVSVRRVCLVTLWIQVTMTQWAGFPHSEIHGSTLAHSSPWLIAVCHALHRLSVPRHPPDALQRLIAEPSRTGASPVNATSRLHQHFGFHRIAAGLSSIAGFEDRPSTLWGQICNLFTMTKSEHPRMIARAEAMAVYRGIPFLHVLSRRARKSRHPKWWS